MSSSLLQARASPSLSFSSSISAANTQWRFTSSPAVTFTRRTRNYTVRAKIREIFMPALSSTMTEGKIVSWIKSEGDVLSKGESVVVVESDKADMDVETFYDGILAAIVVPEGESAPVGAPIGLLAETEAEIEEAKAKAASAGSSAPSIPAASAPSPPPPPPAPVAAPSTPAAAPVAADGSRKIVSTPFAKKLAKQHKVDINKVIGTGPFGRITPADVEAAAGIKPAKSSPATATATAPSAPPPAAPAKSSPTFAEIPGATIVPFTTMQAAVSKNMIESLSVPTFRVGYPIITDALDALYEKVKFMFTYLLLKSDHTHTNHILSQFD